MRASFALVFLAACAQAGSFSIPSIEVTWVSLPPAPVSTATDLSLSFASNTSGAYALLSRSLGDRVLARGRTARDLVEDVVVAASLLGAGEHVLELVVFGEAGGVARTAATVVVVSARALLMLSGDMQFGALQVGEEATRTLTLQNVGEHPASSIAWVTASTPSDFAAVPGTCNGELLPGEACTYLVTWRPARPGAASAELSFSYDDGVAVTSTGASASGDASCAPPATISVAPTYLGAGSNWGDYVRTSATNVACDGTETDRLACIHGGERRTAVLPDGLSCDGLAISDALGAFEWRCVPGNPARAISVQLARGKGLRHLIAPDTGTAFSPNSLVATDTRSSCLRASSLPATWWSNPVASLPGVGSATGAVTLAGGEGVIYTVAVSNTTNGIVVPARHVSIVVLPDATLSWGGRDDVDSSFVTNDQHFLWVEGRFDGRASVGTGVRYGVACFGGAFSRINGMEMSYTRRSGIYSAGFALVVTDASVDHAGLGQPLGDPLPLAAIDYPASQGRLSRIRLSNSRQGLALFSSGGVVREVSAFGNELQNLFVSNCCGRIDATVLLAYSASSSAESFDIGHAGATVAHVTSLHSTGDAYRLGAANVTTTGLLSVSSGGNGVLVPTSGATFSGLGVAHASSSFIAASGNDTSFRDTLFLGALGNGCVVTGMNVQLDSACRFGSPWIDPSIFDADSLFIGAAGSDSRNAHGATAAFDSIDDWTHFERPSRGFGRPAGATLAAPTARGRCSSGTCQIWDLALAASAGPPRALYGLYATDGDCPASTDARVASNVLTDKQTMPNTFLAHAYELEDDFDAQGTRIGDDDGLCESNEGCVFAPNLGAYQGHGALLTGCTFHGGNGVDGVTLLGYETNGY